ncbi:hypothetical protein SAMD00019534_038780 [Acytostelium subglobosum LB1]|uniref:hypothetical protein n=1 Tax=Acytostelium subglobosum LB1 TaxID=1410327 RepID=UPI000644A624|nr:hypothetical protein SAMD00019534_038780 [Acytostelium subglobosum LB1]GAM20703.1 hypothetical protein SAMD00019534_038780 [Acytostelium subglobosum LB1]|eukprot:XP_012760224.1 hypothetical protein SAMD00019534_038780 [Acytostelium subglobosum LB1]
MQIDNERTDVDDTTATTATATTGDISTPIIDTVTGITPTTPTTTDSASDEEERLFFKQLNDFYIANGSFMNTTKRPQQKGKLIRLFALYNSVVDMGGYNEISTSDWNDFGAQFNISGSVKQVYLKYLIDFEKTFFKRDDKPSASASFNEMIMESIDPSNVTLGNMLKNSLLLDGPGGQKRKQITPAAALAAASTQQRSTKKTKEENYTQYEKDFETTRTITLFSKQLFRGAIESHVLNAKGGETIQKIDGPASGSVNSRSRRGVRANGSLAVDNNDVDIESTTPIESPPLGQAPVTKKSTSTPTTTKRRGAKNKENDGTTLEEPRIDSRSTSPVYNIDTSPQDKRKRSKVEASGEDRDVIINEDDEDDDEQVTPKNQINVVLDDDSSSSSSSSSSSIISVNIGRKRTTNQQKAPTTSTTTTTTTSAAAVDKKKKQQQQQQTKDNAKTNPNVTTISRLQHGGTTAG